MDIVNKNEHCKQKYSSHKIIFFFFFFGCFEKNVSYITSEINYEVQSVLQRYEGISTTSICKALLSFADITQLLG